MSAGRGPTPSQARNVWEDILARWSAGRIFDENAVQFVREMYYDVTVRTPHAFSIMFRLVALTLTNDRMLIDDNGEEILLPVGTTIPIERRPSTPPSVRQAQEEDVELFYVNYRNLM